MNPQHVDVVLAHGGTAGAVAEALFLAVPVVVFVILSRWAKRKAAAVEAEGGPADDQEPPGVSRLLAARPGVAPVGVVAVVVAGSAALLARPWLAQLPVHPVPVLVALFVILLVVGATWRLPDELGEGRPPLPAWLALGIGVGAFGVGRLLAVGTLPVAPFVLRSVALTTLAVVSEEAFFRRLAYGVATGWGPVVAVVTSSAVFAAVHVTVWGWGVLPLDLAAGLVLGWQRWACGRWTVPAATHAAANVLAVI